MLQKHEKAFALPRKFKIGFFANGNDLLRASIQDLAFVAKIRDGQRGFAVYAGGGMGRESSVGIELCGFLPETQIFRATLALVALFYDHGNRENRHQARLRFVLKRLGNEAFQRLYLEYFAQAEAPSVEVPARTSPDTPEKLMLLKAVTNDLRISGCLNACSGHPAAQIGIECLRRREGEAMKTLGRVFTGAGVGQDGRVRLSEQLPDEPVSPEQLTLKVVELGQR